MVSVVVVLLDCVYVVVLVGARVSSFSLGLTVVATVSDRVVLLDDLLLVLFCRDDDVVGSGSSDMAVIVTAVACPKTMCFRPKPIS